MTANTTSAVLSAIADITGKIGSVKKTGRNQFHNYDYATAGDILHKLQPMLAEAGLIIIPTQKELRFLDQQQVLLAIDYEFALHHKSGAVHPDKPVITGMANARNTKGGFDDKAANKCLMAATKYFMLTLFKIPTGDYDDADADDDAAPAKKANGNGHARDTTGELVSTDQLSDLRKAMDDAGADEPLFLAYINKSRRLAMKGLSDLPAYLFDEAKEALGAKAKRK